MAILIQLAGTAALATCDPATDPDKSDVANARAAVEAQCGCAMATTHGAYVRCAVQEANAVLVNKSCAGTVRKCASKSTCGRPGAVTCCRTSAAGRTSCAIKRDAGRCVAPRGGQACVGGLRSCCDACGTSGCAVPTTSTTSTTLPPICGDGQVNQGSEECDGTTLGICPGSGFACGDPGGGSPCQCCIVPGASFVVALPCCDGSSPQVAGPHAFECFNRSGRCDPPSVCELGSCQPDHSCCSAAGGLCVVIYPPPFQTGMEDACCGGLACRASQGTGFFTVIDCCVSDGSPCASDAECCTTHCTAGVCDQCRAPGAACAADGECCTSPCVGGVCGPCLNSGTLCTDGVQCCSGACNPILRPPVGTCQ